MNKFSTACYQKKKAEKKKIERRKLQCQTDAYQSSIAMMLYILVMSEVTLKLEIVCNFRIIYWYFSQDWLLWVQMYKMWEIENK